MALNLNMRLNNGLNIENAYIKILSVGGNKLNAVIEIGIFVDKIYTDNKYIEKKFYNFIPSVEDTSKNWIKQGYEHLKTLDEYKYSIDVLED